MIASVSVSDYLETQYVPGRLELSALAADQLRIAVRLLNSFLGHAAALGELSERLLLEWMRWLAKERKAATVNAKRSAVVTLWLAASDDGYCAAPNLRRLPRMREPERVPIAWTMEELQSFFVAAEKMPGRWGDCRISDAWRLAGLVLWDTAIRLTTLLKIEVRHVNLAGGLLFVPAENVKGRYRDRLFRLHPQTIDAIKATLPSDRQMLWPFPWKKRQVWSHLRKVLDAAGLPSDSKRMFHCFRRSAESHAAAQAGVPFSAAAVGHSEAVAKRSYISPAIVSPPSLVDVLPRPTF